MFLVLESVFRDAAAASTRDDRAPRLPGLHSIPRPKSLELGAFFFCFGGRVQQRWWNCALLEKSCSPFGSYVVWHRNDGIGSNREVAETFPPSICCTCTLHILVTLTVQVLLQIIKISSWLITLYAIDGRALIGSNFASCRISIADKIFLDFITRLFRSRYQ